MSDVSNRISKTFVIRTSPGVMKRIERFFGLLHHSSNHGHSGTFGMHLDGDGEDKVTVEPAPQFSTEVSLIGSVGGDLEIADNDSYTCLDTKPLGSRWVVKRMPLEISVPSLLKNDRVVDQSAKRIDDNT